MSRQPRVTELVPKSYVSLTLAFFAGVALIAALEGLYAWMPRFAHLATDGRIEAFDLDGEGSLCVWFSSMLLTSAAGMALVIYSVRRHRPDDYHGRYRIWRAAAAVWLVMSIDETGSLHEGFKEMLAHFTGQRLMGDGSLWWVMPCMAVLGYVGLRLVIDMRACRLSTATFVLAGVSFAVAVLAQLGILLPESGARGVMLEEGCEMLGFLLILMTMTIHARYVILESTGQLGARGQRDGAEGADQPKRRRRTKIDTAHETPPPPKRTDLDSVQQAKQTTAVTAARTTAAPSPLGAKLAAATAARSAAAPSRADDDDDAADGDRKLSRAERKAMRRARDQDRRRFG